MGSAVRTTGQPVDGNRPRLLVLASTYPRWPGDPEPGFVHELARRLSGAFEVTVLCPHAAGAARRESMEGVDVLRFRYAPDRFERLVNDGGIVTNLRRAPWKWLLVPGFALGLLWEAMRLLRSLRPAVMHAHWLLPQGLAAALAGSASGVPFLVTSHGADLFALTSRPLQGLKRFVARRAAAVTVVSEEMRDAFERLGIDRARVEVQPMGVDLAMRFTPDPAATRSRDELLFVGRLVEKKGLRGLIEAMPAIVAARPSAFLTVAGFGPELDERRAQAQRLGLGEKVRFVGAVSQADLPALYRRAALFVAPFVAAASGDREGLGLVAVEAAGCGCPVVVGDLPATRHAFDGPGLAHFVPGGDVDTLARTCVAALASPEASMAMAARARVRLLARFDWDARASAYAGLLSRLASRR